MFDWAQFDPNAHESSSFEAIPAGKYSAVITEAEWRDSKSGGRYLNLRLELADDSCKGRVVFDRLNLVNANETAVEIASRTLADIMRSVGVKCQSEADLVNKPVGVRLKVVDYQGEKRNEVAGYHSLKKPAPKPPEEKKPAFEPVGKGGASVPPGGEDDVPF